MQIAMRHMKATFNWMKRAANCIQPIVIQPDSNTSKFMSIFSANHLPKRRAQQERRDRGELLKSAQMLVNDARCEIRRVVDQISRLGTHEM